MSDTNANQTELERAEALELELRVRVAELVTERRRAGEEASRLEERAQLPAADDETLTQTASRYRARVEALGAELAEARSRLRTQESTVATLRADRDLGPAGPGQQPGGN